MKRSETGTREIGAIFLFFVTIFTLISLISYNAFDNSLYTSSPNSPSVNKAGRTGAYISGYLLYCPFGLGAWFIPLITLIWTYNQFSQTKMKKWSIKLTGMFLVLLTTSSAFSLTTIDTSEGHFLAGGIAGTIISESMLPWLGRWGTYLVIFSLFTIGICLASEFLILSWASSLTRFSSQITAKVLTRLRKPETKHIRVSREPVVRKSEPRKTAAYRVVMPPEAIKSEPVIHKHEEGKTSSEFQLPPIDLLDPPPHVQKEEENIDSRCKILEDALRSFGVESRVVQVNQGPVISSFEIEPARGVKVSRITALADDIALVLKASRVRVVAPIPGKSVVGIEIPNKNPHFVYLKEVMQSAAFSKSSSKLTLGLGKDIFGKPLITDLHDMPHLLIAGTTGSGKTICLNSIILSILFQATPGDVQFLLVDPKRVEMVTFGKLPHLIAPVVTSPKKASKALRWVANEMDKRYQIFAEEGVRNITSFNSLGGGRDKMAHIVVTIDELHDLMIVAQAAVEETITRLAQLSRAVGIHLVIATQRPSVDVITGVIKANLPYRISFQVSSKVDSRTVLDMNGAEKLLGKGDMLFLPPGKGIPIRGQCSFITDKEIDRVAFFLKKQKRSDYRAGIFDETEEKGSSGISPEMSDDDELFDQAVQLVMQAGKASTSMLQRRLSIGYSRAARLLDKMEEKNIISSPRGTKPRTILTRNDKNQD